MRESTSGPPRHLKTRVQEGVLVLTITEPQLHGDKLAHALRQELLAVIAQPASSKVALDLQPVQAMSSEAFRPLLSLRRKLEEAGGRLVLCNLAPAVAKTLQATRLLSTGRAGAPSFEVQADVAAAVAILNSSGTQ
jgi:anti-anti-sigma factor